MTREEVLVIVRGIFENDFQVHPEQFSWEERLENLHEDFKILVYLVFMEQVLEKRFGQKIPLLEEISASIHTPEDLVQLIMKKL